MNRDNTNIIQSNAGLVADVRNMIEQTRNSVAQTVNAGITFLYWRIGKRIQMEVLQHSRAEYGKGILATLSQELSAEFGPGYSYSPITCKVKSDGVAPDEKIVAALRRQSRIHVACIRTTKSSGNRPISRPEASDLALESSKTISSDPINHQRRFISTTTMERSLVSSQPESIFHVANILLGWKEAETRETDKAMRGIRGNNGV